MEKCQYPAGMEMNINGIPVDPCVYEDAEIYKNVTVIISKCKKCGNVEIQWKRQDDTIQVGVNHDC